MRKAAWPYHSTSAALAADGASSSTAAKVAARAESLLRVDIDGSSPEFRCDKWRHSLQKAAACREAGTPLGRSTFRDRICRCCRWPVAEPDATVSSADSEQRLALCRGLRRRQ